MFVARAGDVVTIMTPGGGGFGDPLERPAAQVRADVLSGYISETAAERDYGVVLADNAVDEVATHVRRASIRATRPALRRFEFGPERDAWDAVFDDASMLELNALLLQLGPSVCSRLRREMIERVVPGLASGIRPLQEAIGDIGEVVRALPRRLMRFAAIFADDTPANNKTSRGDEHESRHYRRELREGSISAGIAPCRRAEVVAIASARKSSAKSSGGGVRRSARL